LNVSKNHLTTLPADLVGLRQLELLDISENLLCIMPAEVLERMQFTTLLITGNPLTRPGNCDQQQSSQNAYAKILRQMTQRGIARSSPVTSPLPVKKQADVCGPNGMGCLSVSDSYFAPVSTASFSSCTEIPSSSRDFPSTDSTSYSSSYSSTSSASSASSAFSAYSSSTIASDSSTVEPINTKPLHPTTTFNIEDEDATIDRELSYHAQQLNIDGSRPSTPTILSENRLTGTAKSPLSPSRQSSESYIVDNVDSIPPTARLFHSLCEIATRTLLKSNIEIPKNYLPLHLEQDVLSGKKCRSCAQCQGPFVNEWVTSVQIKSSGSHPGVVRRVRFCSTECWKECLSLDGNGKTEVSLHKVTSS
jgi:hypothetical protein